MFTSFLGLPLFAISLLHYFFSLIPNSTKIFKGFPSTRLFTFLEHKYDK